jgi:predicted SnoaL-like aldol condensation-catalyzing enzyme
MPRCSIATRPITIRTIDIWRVQGDKLAEHWDVIDIGALETS